MKLTYYDPKSQIRLLCYADTVVWDTKPTPTLTALRFGGYPERVQGLADAIYGGATIEIEDGKDTYSLKTLTRQYRRELSHDGVYAEATLIAEDDGQSAKQNAGDKDEPDKDKNDEDDDQIQQDLPPRNTYIFCTPGERRELFDAVDQKTAVPMIPEYQDYVLTELQKRNILRALQVKSLSRKLEAWLLRCEEKDKNIVAVMEDGLKSGAISIPGATVGLNPLDEINSITEYLNTFGVTVAERIKKLFVPLFDPATESLSPEVLAINQYIEDHAGYPLYDAQLAVAEAIKRQLERSKVGLIVAECGSGISKIGAVSIAATAAGLLSHQMSVKVSKTFNLILCPSHVTEKWVRELEETVPNAFAAVVHTPAELDHLYQMFERGNKFCFAVLSKENGDTFDVISIGQAGENLVPMSCMVTSVGNSGGGVPVGVADGHQLAGLTVGMVKRDLPAARGAGAGGYDDLPPWGDVPGDGVTLDLFADGGDPGGLRGGNLAGVADVQV